MNEPSQPVPSPASGSKPFELRYPQGLHVARGLREETLLDQFSSLVLPPRFTANPPDSSWARHRIEPWREGALRIAVDLSFLRGELAECALFHDDDRRYGRDWSEWSERKERRRAAATHDWLADRGWRAGRFAWGELWIGYEPRTAIGGAWVRYEAG